MSSLSGAPDRRSLFDYRAHPKTPQSVPGLVFSISRMARKHDHGISRSDPAAAQSRAVTCAGCGEPATAPFAPRGDRPLNCRDCYKARTGNGGGSRRQRDR